MLHYFVHLIMSSTQEEGFTEVTRGGKKRRPVAHLRFQETFGTSVRPKPNIKNTIPVILSGVNEEFRNWRKLMGELRQFHPGFKISQIKELSKVIF